MKWSVKQVFYQEVSEGHYQSQYITLGSGLSWQEAKELRRGKHGAMIVRDLA
jgi:hypothetical protein